MWPFFNRIFHKLQFIRKGMVDVMKEMIIIIRPEKLETVKRIIDEAGVGGISISSVMGCGTQRGMENGQEASEIKTKINLLPKIRVEIVIRDDKVEEIITEIREYVATGHVGDGKIFVRNIEDAVRIRTSERGNRAL